MTGRSVGVVVIGRNEGARLVACLASLAGSEAEIVYVDSGSTDGSIAAAHRAGAKVVALDMATPFTAARARNAGVRAFADPPAVVQFVDGDCELAPGWIKDAAGFLEQNPEYAAVAGRLREKQPEASIFNALCDAEWDVAAGETDAVGGIAMMRTDAFREAGGFREDLIAGEEPELCVRLRQRGWRIRRLAAEMGRHDAAMFRFGQFMKRAMRSGHAFAEVAEIHRGSPQRIWARDAVRPLVWTALAPAAAAAALLVGPAALALLLVYPVQIVRMARRFPRRRGLTPTAHAALLMAAKPAEAVGVLRYWIGRRSGVRSGLIEHKA